METASALETGGFFSPDFLAAVDKANMALPDCIANENCHPHDVNIHPIDAKETPNLYLVAQTKKNGANFRSLNADVRTQMQVSYVLKPAFQSQKKCK